MAHRCHTKNVVVFFIMIIIVLATLILGEFSTYFYGGFFSDFFSDILTTFQRSLECGLVLLLKYFKKMLF